MARARTGAYAPEVTPGVDLESPTGGKVFGGGNGVNLAGVGGMPNIQPFQGYDAGKTGKKGPGGDSDSMKKIAAVAGAVWLGGWFLGFGLWWPVLLLLEVLYTILSFPPFSWISGFILTPLSWITSLFNRGAPIVEQVGALQEMRLPNEQVQPYLDSYSQQYADAALIFASHDGYPQIVNGLLYDKTLGYRDLIDATDDNGNTALIYSSAKGFKQTTAALLRYGADPDIKNQGSGGRTPLMEAAGAGHKDVVAAIRLSNATIDLQDDFGNTALHYAAYHGHLSTVLEMLKGNPRRDLTNSYGHTAQSYAVSNKHKNIAEVIARGGTANSKRQERASLVNQDAEKSEEHVDAEKQAQDLLAQLGLKPPDGLDKKEKGSGGADKHVKGAAEKLHEEKGKSWKDFAPMLGDMLGGVKDEERKALEDQIAKLKRQHDEAELKAQKRIVELLEKSSDKEKSADDARRMSQEYHLNNTEMSLRIQELESKHMSTEFKEKDEKGRAEHLQEELRNLERDAERHKSRAEQAERERDMHMDSARRHEDDLRRKRDEVNDHLTRIERQSREMQQLRDDIKRKEDEMRRHKDRVAELERGLQGKGVDSIPTPPPTPPPATPPPSPPPSPPPPPENKSEQPPAESKPEASPQAPEETALEVPSGQEAAPSPEQPDAPAEKNTEAAAAEGEASAASGSSDSTPAPPEAAQAVEAGGETPPAEEPPSDVEEKTET